METLDIEKNSLPKPIEMPTANDESTETSAKLFRSVKARWLSSFRHESGKREELEKMVAAATPTRIKMESDEESKIKDFKVEQIKATTTSFEEDAKVTNIKVELDEDAGYRNEGPQCEG